VNNAIRSIAFLGGLVLLGAVAHVTIMSTGGYGQTGAPLVLALAAGVALGAFVIGRSRRLLALALFVALVAGEGYGLMRTADMYVANREVQQAPIHEAGEKHTAAVARLAAAEKSDAVAKAEAAKAKIDADAIAASVAKTCRDNCRLVLDAQAAAANAAVEAARKAVQVEVAAARADLQLNPLPPSASPLADRMGVPAWSLDLVIAGLGSIGCNGLAACLIAFAAHGPRSATNLGAPRETPVTVAAPRILRTPRNPRREVLQPVAGDINAFMLARVSRMRGAQVSWSDLFTEYLAWCRTEGFEADNVEAFGSSLDALRQELGLRVRKHDGGVYFVGLGINRLRLIAS
jgi:hypothetical protein